MASSLVRQLQQIAAESTNTLNKDKIKSIHSTSLLFPKAYAATQDLDSIFAIALEGFHDLCTLDDRFNPFARTLFSETSKDVDRFQQTKAEVKTLNRSIESFLELVSGRLLLKPALKAVEWLVRRFRIQDQNTTALLLAFLPYHAHPTLFPAVLNIIEPKDIPHELKFIRPYLKPATPIPRHVITHTLSHRREFLELLINHVFSVVAAKRDNHALLSFFAAVMTESFSLMCDAARSPTKSGITEEEVLQRALPLLQRTFQSKKSPEFQIGGYMLTTVLVSKMPLKDEVSLALMRDVANGFTHETVTPAFACLALIAQTRTGDNAYKLPKDIVAALLQTPSLLERLQKMAIKYRIDNMVAGLVNGVFALMGQKYGQKEFNLVVKLLQGSNFGPKVQKSILGSFVELAQDLNRLNDKPRDQEAIREELSTLLVEWTEQGTDGKIGKILPGIFSEKNVDLEMLELSLRTVIPRQITASDESGEKDAMAIEAPKPEKITVSSLVENIPKSLDVVSFLAPGTEKIHKPFEEAFIVGARSQNAYEIIFAHPVLAGRESKDARALTLLASIWITQSAPIIVRSNALKQASKMIQSISKEKIDFQALIPLGLVALADPAERVRKEADGFIRTIREAYQSASDAGQKKKKSKGDTMEYWGYESIYGTGKETENLQWLDSHDAKKFLDAIIGHGMGECVMDASFIGKLLATEVGSTKGQKKDEGRLKSSTRTSVMAFLCSHAACVPQLLVRYRLLAMLNGINRSRTEYLLPVLESWAARALEDRKAQCVREHVDFEALESQLIRVVAPGENIQTVAVLLNIIGNATGGQNLVSVAAKHVVEIWDSLDESVQTSAIQILLNTRLSNAPGAAEATEILSTVRLSTETFRTVLDQARGLLKPALEWKTIGTVKRRRTVASDRPIEQEEVIAAAVTFTTVVLEMLETQGAGEHSQLMGMLFSVLGDIGMADFSGITFMQNLLLSCIRDIVKLFKTTSTDFNLASQVRADVLVSCVRSTASPQVQNLALLLLSDLADIAPDTVKHSVMPIFTFMGANTLRQDDEYSAHVIEQTVKRIIPPLVKSLYEGGGDPLIGAAELIGTFVMSYKHVPVHRRVRLYSALTETLGPKDFGFALLVKLAARYNVEDADNEVKEFCSQLMAQFPASVQVTAAIKYLDIIVEFLAQPNNAVAQILLTEEEDNQEVSHIEMSQRLLGGLKAFLSSPQLKQKTARLFKSETPETETLHQLFTQAMERVMLLGEKYAKEAIIAPYTTSLMDILLDLLSIPEFVRVIDALLSREQSLFRSSALTTFRDRVYVEYRTDDASRAAILSLSSRIARLIPAAFTSNELKADAILCLQAVTIKFGRSDLNTIASLADTVVGPGALGNTDTGLRVLSLVTLTHMTTALGGRIVPVLPKSMPAVITYLQTATANPDETQRLLHNAAFRYIQELINTVPSFMTTYLPKLLPLVAESAKHEVFQELTAAEVREDFLDALAEKLEFKAVITAFTKTWPVICNAGDEAMEEAAETVQKAVENSSKSTVQKASSSLLTFFINALDVRRVEGLDQDSGDVEELETLVVKAILDMVYKLNDSIFKPMFIRFVEWAVEDLKGSDEVGCLKRTITLWKLLGVLSENLKALVTDYFSHPLPAAISFLSTPPPPPSSPISSLVLTATTTILSSLTTAFITDDRDFWLSPTHFTPLLPCLLSLLTHPSTYTYTFTTTSVIPAIVELAIAAMSEDHSKQMNQGLLKLCRDENWEIRLSAVTALKEVWTRVGEDWMALLPESVPVIAELLEDDEEAVERETQRWIAEVEGFLGEGEVMGMLT
ncbi:hypothetical protein EX30DRAFT_318094 [Ascodesmis nigricans]|uniref:U3 small nucleolar RNA-associated protein 10 n=1 Tax=Ascodesmis nigricans TaxID=341454 RepID=A0A4V3SJ05_9PEZI|nr:hypothetical protein EX30DRAFT_318094 [Ascodesmis nigricans]